MRKTRRGLLASPLSLLVLVAALSASAEEASTPSAADNTPRPLLPEVELSLPEGDFDFRLGRLVDKVFWQGQLKYDFVDGDISAFLRYRYYGYRRTYQLSVFDAIEFDDIEEFSDDFERVRGALFLVRWPHDYHQRTFFAAELDDLSTNRDERLVDDGETNTFLRLGYQIGTPDDTRSNAIVGEPRARIRRLFSPFRTIGPGDAGLTAALTWSFDDLGGDFDYLKLELETLKRFEMPGKTFMVARAHGGTFFHKTERPGASPDNPLERFLVPINELFRLNGSENLRGLDREVRGTEEFHLTSEFLVPWFVDLDKRVLKADWQTWYWVLYGGYGIAGFDRDVFQDLDDYVLDLGVGFQTSFKVRGYTLFLSALAAREVESGADVKLRFIVKSYH